MKAISIAIASCLASAATPAFAQSTSAETQKVIDDKRAWVQSFEAGDYFFWERFFRRMDNQREFPMPEEWYVPSVLVEGAPNQPLPVAATPAISQAALKTIDDYAFTRETGALVILHKGAIAYEKYAEGKHAGSLLPVRSFTKTLPSLLIGVAINEGKIKSIDEPVRNYLPEWKDDARGSITIRHFLHMASGIENVPLRYEPGNKNLLLAEGSKVNQVALSFDKAVEPDTLWTVNQVDSQILGLIVERAVGRPFAEYLSEKLWRPLGASTATLNLDGKGGDARVFCCMRSIAQDWLRVGQMLAQQGRWNGKQLIPAAYVVEMGKPSPANPYMGLHLWRGWSEGQPQQRSKAGTPLMASHANPYAADDVIYLLGGASILAWIVPSLELVIVRWGNDPKDWDASFIPNTVIRDLKPKRPSR